MKNGRRHQKKISKMTSILRQSYWDYLITKTSKTNGFDTIEIDLVIIYIGKGCWLRKSSHLAESYKVLSGSMNDGKLPKRLIKILDIWGNGRGIIVLELCSNSNHFISMCRENAMIRVVWENLTNLINGAAYGAMKTTWTPKDTILYGDMLLILHWENDKVTFFHLKPQSWILKLNMN